MATRLTCDMCDKPIETRIENFQMLFRPIRAIVGIEFANPKYYDLCAGCAIKVRDFINHNISEKDTDA